MGETSPNFKTKDEINVQYSRLCTMNGDKHLRRKLLLQELESLNSDIERIELDMIQVINTPVQPELVPAPTLVIPPVDCEPEEHA